MRGVCVYSERRWMLARSAAPFGPSAFGRGWLLVGGGVSWPGVWPGALQGSSRDRRPRGAGKAAVGDPGADELSPTAREPPRGAVAVAKPTERNFTKLYS